MSIVFQGNMPLKGSAEYQLFFENLAEIRLVFPDSPILLGTWNDCEVPRELEISHVEFLKDPGQLPSFKKNTPYIDNNVNRQIICSSQILEKVLTRYTLKLRLDCELQYTGFLEYYSKYGKTTDGHERIVVPSFFTIDPRMYEQMPFHISDWVAFGLTKKIQQMWKASFMSKDDATYYDQNYYAAHSTYFDKLYRSRFAIEQYIAVQYASKLGYVTPVYHNYISGEILINHDKFSAREFLILDLSQFGIICRKYIKASKSSFQYLNCLKFLDWYLLNVVNDPGFKVDITTYQAALRRKQIKKIASSVMFVTNPLMPLIKKPFIKPVVSAILRAFLISEQFKNNYL